MNAYNLNKEKHRRQRGVYYFWTFPQGFLHWKERFLSLPAMRTRLSTECMSLETSVTSTSSCSVCFQVNLYFISRVWADMMHHVRCNVSAKPESVEEGWQNSCVVYYRLSWVGVIERAPCGDERNDFGCEALSLVAPSQTSKSETMRSSSGLSWRAKEHYLKLLKIR